MAPSVGSAAAAALAAAKPPASVGPTTLAELKERLPKAVNTPELRFSCPEERKFGAIAEVKATLPEADPHHDPNEAHDHDHDEEHGHEGEVHFLLGDQPIQDLWEGKGLTVNRFGKSQRLQRLHHRDHFIPALVKGTRDLVECDDGIIQSNNSPIVTFFCSPPLPPVTC